MELYNKETLKAVSYTHLDVYKRQVYDFVKYSSYSYYPKKVLGEFKEDAIKFAKSEGLDAHANSVAVRFEEE